MSKKMGSSSANVALIPQVAQHQTPSFTVLKRRVLRGEVCAEAGDRVWLCKGYDYGCANDDTGAFGVPHVSVTKDPEGDYPFFTIPRADLERAQ